VAQGFGPAIGRRRCGFRRAEALRHIASTEPHRAAGGNGIERDANPRRSAETHGGNQPETGGDSAGSRADGVGGIEHRCRRPLRADEGEPVRGDRKRRAHCRGGNADEREADRDAQQSEANGRRAVGVGPGEQRDGPAQREGQRERAQGDRYFERGVDPQHREGLRTVPCNRTAVGNGL
jgi:hypothetical protein